MSELLHLIFVAIVQGITEWFPISSDGHLILVDNLLGREPNFLFDVALHFGTLMAVFVYFGREITDILRDFLSGNWGSENGKLGVLILVGTLPVVFFGFLLRDIVELSYSSLTVAAVGFAVTGVTLLIAVVYKPKRESSLSGLSYRDALLIGLAQVTAIMPGISRSGTTLVAGILLGLKIKDSAKFSFLLSVPAVFGANVLVMGGNSLPSEFILPTAISFIVGIIAIYLLYRFAFSSVKNLKWFAFYVLALAAAILIFTLL